MADGAGYSLTVRTDRAREIAGKIDPEKIYTVEIKEYRKKRSLDQNAMYWAVLTQAAKKLRVSNNYMHNTMLCKYGEIETFDGKAAMIVLPDTEEASEKAFEAQDYHLKPTSEIRTGKDGKPYRTWLLLKGSSSMDTAEFTRLMDGLLSEAKELGIEMIYE